MLRGITFAFAYLALALASGLAPAMAQGLVVPCGQVEGQWSWSTGGVVTIEAPGEAPGRAFWAPDVSAPPAFDAEWVCDEAAGEIVITWKQGMIDTLRLSETGDRLAGNNQIGVAVEGERYRAKAAVTPSGPVPPQLVGTWLLEIQLPSPQGPIPVVWRIEPDGRYSIDAGVFSHAGQMTAFGGEWELTAETKSFGDGGKYEFQNWATLVTRARTGIGRWFRREPLLQLETAELSGQPLPTNVPALVANARAVAAFWRPDAILVSIDFERNDAPNPLVQDEIELSFMSPATGAGLVVSVEATGARFFVHDVVNWGANDIPDGFLDLPTVWAMARQHGLLPPLERAGLKIWEPQDQGLILAWSLGSARGEIRGIALDAVSGAKLDGDLSGYVATYNAQWQAAAAGLKKLFQQPRRPSSSSFSFSSSSDYGSDSSSSYDSDDSSSSSSSSSYGGAQGAWSAGDMGAYGRIMSGTPSGDDCYRYSC